MISNHNIDYMKIKLLEDTHEDDPVVINANANENEDMDENDSIDLYSETHTSKANEYDILSTLQIHAISSFNDYILLAIRILLGYSNLFFDITCMALLYLDSKDSIPIALILSICITQLPAILISIFITNTPSEVIIPPSSSSSSWILSRLLSNQHLYLLHIITWFHGRYLLEGYISWKNQLYTRIFCLVDIIYITSQGFCCSVLQLIVILYHIAYSKNDDDDDDDDIVFTKKYIYVFYASICISIIRSSFTCATLLKANEIEHRWSIVFSMLLFFYFISEKIYRIIFYAIVLIYLFTGKSFMEIYIFSGLFIIFSIYLRHLIVKYSHQRVQFQPSTSSYQQPTTTRIEVNHNQTNITTTTTTTTTTNNNNNSNTIITSYYSMITSLETWYLIGKLCMSLTTSHNWIGEYILTSRFIMLEFLESIYYIPILIWCEDLLHYEKYELDWKYLLSWLILSWIVKSCLLIALLYFKRHARHLVYNHIPILLKECLIAIGILSIIWSILMICTYTIL